MPDLVFPHYKGKKVKVQSMGSVPVGVEGVSVATFHFKADGQSLLAALPYFQPGNDPVSQLSGMRALLRWNFPYKFCPGRAPNPGPRCVSTAQTPQTQPSSLFTAADSECSRSL